MIDIGKERYYDPRKEKYFLMVKDSIGRNVEDFLDYYQAKNKGAAKQWQKARKKAIRREGL